MIRSCCICGKNYPGEFREWYEYLVPRVCSGSCYGKWLDQEAANHAVIPGGREYPKNLVNADRRSSYEIRLEKWLVASGISYAYEPFSFDLGRHWYVPDFCVNLATFVEVKGLWNAGDKTKVKEFLKTGRHLHLIDEQFLRRLSKNGGIP